ncbi:response regulator receiver domain protein [Leptospira inadai serovar Lyme str. 10]|uniref:Response regulator receiver domain protein n=2 Tax=Leptospira inadai serovar Lyme TaxID=293084 RepID=V6HBT8_9LEPT|nr:response regulator transcription factor [Leptospira inadai]EQA37196.1 response regulator receiver domain protein [Leptospira inadai serovar Lyme str. 10]PNV76674.1 DNA-binding response regulator [Leptospira inadai serovar Lyme]
MKILIIEDDVRMADLIKRGLEEEGFEVSVAYDGNMGRKLSLNYEFDLIITDIVLPVFSGLELCKEIRNIKPYIPIIMLTALGATDDKVEAFDAGADDYLVKPFDFRELHVRIRTLLKRANASGSGQGFLLRFSDLVMNMQTKTVSRAGVEIELTPKEFKFLEYLVRNSGRVLSRREIAEKVWGTNFDTGTNFIDVYINYLRKKIDRDFSTKLIHTKSGMGFILKEGP